jgi:hypothetical protein
VCYIFSPIITELIERLHAQTYLQYSANSAASGRDVRGAIARCGGYGDRDGLCVRVRVRLGRRLGVPMGVHDLVDDGADAVLFVLDRGLLG